MNKEQLAEVLDKHRKWLLDEDGGERANLRGANLRDANLSYANLSGANLRDANLSYANLSGANLSYANLSYANLRGANLSEADLSEANLRWANLRWANLRGADLRWADLRGADLSEANLRYADLRGADLSEANLSGANLWSVAGDSNHIKSLFVSEQYAIAYTSEYLQIGCERHKISEWWDFDDRRILKMDGKTALEFWHQWKPVIKQMIEFSPASPTGKESEQEVAA